MKKTITTIILICSMFSFTNIYAEDVDPWEEFNRSMYQLNSSVDTILKPVTQAYIKLPNIVKTGISNFFANIADVNTSFNQFLQTKGSQGVESLFRIIVNSTAGIVGFIEVQERPPHKEDLGQTLAVWGVTNGPYLVLPFLGPSTVRDSLALFSDIKLIRHFTIEDINDNNFIQFIYVAGAIDKRVELLPITDLLDKADDPYIAYREAYLQKRKYEIVDGRLSTEVEF